MTPYRYEIFRFGQFISVGAVGATINFGLTFLLTEGGLHYLLAAAIGIETAFLFNFTGNAYWTFGDIEFQSLYNYLTALARDHIVRGVGLVINLGILWVLVEYVGVWYLIAHAVGAGVAVAVNFSGNFLWVFGVELE